ncbi:DUF1499 domain-containing protein [Romeria aff. gracilis LEGE 07310]|uniref:DUF1499 domain-containing protein n=1 Tax=Vasconcelosia minhoensis LEGE 07310 TaxID=915328 RepID=A0A8J7AH37_9CYAN|nr:DUF1499 domain-containing protein [Romeria gracilis]MBE9079016.1 DUF1499 domain-containing protein [Romeria aff. gracilis LEGE 07310]
MSLFTFSGQKPKNLGVKQGQLTACPGTPNCVNSQAIASDKDHYIKPIAHSGPAQDAIATLQQIVKSMEGSTVNEATDTYLYAEFASKIMGFVDDVEFYAVPDGSVIHVRSAARLGKSDLGVNRKRIESIRQEFQSRA